jgi:nitrogen fixation NifU-like protein
MSELMDLYQEVILDHNRKPRNRGPLDNADHEAKGDNPLCGDQLTLYLKMDGDRVTEIRFEGRGCAISVASASLMTEAITGKSLGEIEALYESFHELLTGDPSVAGEADTELGKLRVFEGVREFPVRVKCATLAWHTLMAALEDEGASITTE